MVSEAQIAPKKRRERSPAYPAIDLETAIQRLEKVYEKESRQPVPVSVIMEHWNYTPKSSYGLQTVAALLKYELMEDEGSGLDRLVKITDLGLSILVPENASEQQRAIKQAALSPAIINDVWTNFKGQLPSDGTIKVYLIRQRTFNPRSVDEVIGVIRRTIEFSKPAYGDPEVDEVPMECDEQSVEEASNPTQLSFTSDSAETAASEIDLQPNLAEKTVFPTVQSQVRTLQLPLFEGKWAQFQAPFPISEYDWQQMLAVLEAMKPGLVINNSQEQSATVLEELDVPDS